MKRLQASIGPTSGSVTPAASTEPVDIAPSPHSGPSDAQPPPVGLAAAVGGSDGFGKYPATPGSALAHPRVIPVPVAAALSSLSSLTTAAVAASRVPTPGTNQAFALKPVITTAPAPLVASIPGKDSGSTITNSGVTACNTGTVVCTPPPPAPMQASVQQYPIQAGYPPIPPSQHPPNVMPPSMGPGIHPVPGPGPGVLHGHAVAPVPGAPTKVIPTPARSNPVPSPPAPPARQRVHGPLGSPSPPSGPPLPTSQQQQQQFQRLKVEDALSYLDQVKFKFGNQPHVYNDFLDIMKEFKSQSINTPGVIQRVSNLFKGHPELIVGFNTFLPPGYKIEVQTNGQVTCPSSGNATLHTTTVVHTPQGIHTHHSSSPAPLTLPPQPSIHPAPSGPPIGAPVAPTAIPPRPLIPPLVTPTNVPQSKTPPHQPQGAPLPAHITSTTPRTSRESSPHLVGEPSYLPAPPPHVPPPTISGPPASHHVPTVPALPPSQPAEPIVQQRSPQSLVAPPPAAPQNQPEFNHAINYVNKIKNRFQGQPNVYKQFLEILHTYQKEQQHQRSMKDGGLGPGFGKSLSEAEVYTKVARLFENQEDLLQEFGQFLPDATNGSMFGEAWTAFKVKKQPVSSKVTSNDHVSASKRPPVKTLPNSQSTFHPHNQVIPPVPPAPATKAPMPNASIPPYPPVKRPPGLLGTVPGQPQLPGQGQPPAKKPRMTSIRDVSLAEAAKYGTLNEFAFFDKVHKALGTGVVYENFLRCLLLFNQEVISRGELLQIVQPFLARFPDLYRWFKDFIGFKNGAHAVIEPIPNSALRERSDKVGLARAMEIDYSTCKRLGASYCALPKTFVPPRCTGETELSKEVLNMTWVSFPSWSEDSTFVSSRKTQFEEQIYRCEDERFELDTVLELNASAIKSLEGVMKKISHMSPEEQARFRLDDTLGGRSTVHNQRAIKRIYGERSPEIIEGLKKNPAVAIPVVLRRLKMKQEEWREAQKGFNKIWNEQNEKYFLKSLDHQGINFKQTDVKYLRSKSLLNEIETLYDERTEQAEDNGMDAPSGPHLTLEYPDRSVLIDAGNLMIHHARRQPGITKDDKRRIKTIVRHTVPDLFHMPRQELSDDEDEEEDGEGGNCKESEKLVEKEPNEKRRNWNQTEETEHVRSKDSKKEGKKEQDCKSPESDPDFPPSSESAMAYSNNPDEEYSMLLGNNPWYVFLRLHHLLCTRLAKILHAAAGLAAEEKQEKKQQSPSVAVALRLRPKREIEIEDYYPAFLDMVKNYLDGNLDSSAYEDTLREMFGIHAYVAFTLDKLISNAVRQLQNIVTDEVSTKCWTLYQTQASKNATGGRVDTAHMRYAKEYAYQRKGEMLLPDENCFKIIIFKNDCKMSIELLDTDTREESDGERDSNIHEAGKWSEYVDQYLRQGREESEDNNKVKYSGNISDKLREVLLRKPVFLPRNLSRCPRDRIRFIARDHPQDGNNRLRPTVELEEGKEYLDLLLEPLKDRMKETDEAEKERGPIVEDNLQCRFQLNNRRMVFVGNSAFHLYHEKALSRAHQSHEPVSHRLNSRFRDWHAKWTSEHVSDSQQKSTLEWLLGKRDSLRTNRTEVFTDNDVKRPPYVTYNRYRVVPGPGFSSDRDRRDDGT